MKGVGLARARCPHCGKTVAVAPPAGGDGSQDVFRRHNDRDGQRCEMSRSPVRDGDYLPGDDFITRRAP